MKSRIGKSIFSKVMFWTSSSGLSDEKVEGCGEKHGARAFNWLGVKVG